MNIQKLNSALKEVSGFIKSLETSGEISAGEQYNIFFSQVEEGSLAVLEMEPKLAEVFGEAMQRVLDGRMDLSIFKELAAYAAYRLNIVEGDANAVRQESSRNHPGPSTQHRPV